MADVDGVRCEDAAQVCALDSWKDDDVHHRDGEHRRKGRSVGEDNEFGFRMSHEKCVGQGRGGI